MFSGFNEILLVAAIVIAVIFIPRLTATRGAGSQRTASSGLTLSGQQRLFILASIIWVTFWAVYCEPWRREWQLFAYIGAGPVLVIWGAFWVLQGGKGKSGDR